MTIHTVHTITCDGCGSEIPSGVVLPVVFLDENRDEIHFCDHRCLVPYAEHRHAERVAAVYRHLAGNVSQIESNLAEAQFRESHEEVSVIRPHLEPAKQALADHVTKYGGA